MVSLGALMSSTKGYACARAGFPQVYGDLAGIVEVHRNCWGDSRLKCKSERFTVELQLEAS